MNITSILQSLSYLHVKRQLGFGYSVEVLNGFGSSYLHLGKLPQSWSGPEKLSKTFRWEAAVLLFSRTLADQSQAAPRPIQVAHLTRCTMHFLHHFTCHI